MTLKLHIGNYIFAPKLIITLLAVICIPILISLGFWQLDRADEKRVIDAGVNDAIKKAALNLNEADLTQIDKEIYRTGLLSGQYEREQFLLDNRTHKGRPGYHVISPFVFEQKTANKSLNYAVLINRGWISYNGTRDQITDISIENKIVEITGSIKRIPRSIVLKKQQGMNKSDSFTFNTNGKPLNNVDLIQSIDLGNLNNTLKYELLPVIIELDETKENGFIREWQPYYGSIDKHNAYAVQWFAMAAILLFLFLKLNIRKN